MSDTFKAAHLSEMELPQPTPDVTWAAVRHHMGVSSFGINAWTGAAGSHVIGEHDEVSGTSPGKHEELYIVIEGYATFTVEGETVDAPAGTAIFVREPAAKRGAVATVDNTTILAIGARPGEVFQPSRWERSLPVLAHFAAAEYDAAHEALRELDREQPNDPTTLYNLACAESRLGRRDEAFAHLRRSIESDDRFRVAAKTDADLNAIRDDPRFAELVG